MERRYRLYLETSFWNRLGDPAHPDSRKVSYRFLRAIRRRHDVWISPLVLEEVDATPEPEERRIIRRLIRSARSDLAAGRGRAEMMASDLQALGGFRTRLVADLTHAGYSILTNMDALVTWDEGDLAREKTRLVVQAYCRRRRLQSPLIGTPPDVARWLNIEI